MPSEDSQPRHDHTHATFPATRWTLVGRLRESGPDAEQALEELCRTYWYPIYATLRRSGRAQHDAEDLTQGFFLELLHDRTLHAADPGRGRLRSFLLGALKRFMARSERHRLAEKRGGGTTMLSIEWERGEERYLCEPVDERTPDTIYLRAWAHSLVERVREKVRASFAGREAAYAALEPFIEGDEHCIPYRELGERLGESESGARLVVFRLRQRFRKLLTEAVRQTVETPDEVEEELAWVMAMLSERAA